MSNNERTIMVEYLTKIYGEDFKVPMNMTMRESFKQFFTPQEYSQVMINRLSITNPKKIIDLAMGEGSLLVEAMKRWKDAKYYGNDIDINCCNKICNSYPDVTCSNEDIFLESTINNLQSNIGKVDLCLGNPPFHLINQTQETKSILREYNLDNQYKSKKIPAEVIFILQCLTILDDDGYLSLILPDGFFVNRNLKNFRSFLLENYEILEVLELPSNIFEKTDAKTHIITIRKSKKINTNIELSIISKPFAIKITKEQAINRMDFSYYKSLENFKNSVPLSSLDIEFIRGKIKYQIENIKNEHILHTTSFSNGQVFKNNLRTISKLKKYEHKIARPNDIVIARVGSSCIGKVGLIQKGYFVATDCIFIIRVKNEELRNKIFSLLNSKKGKEWILSNSKGVAAKHITLEDIKRFPFIVGDE